MAFAGAFCRNAQRTKFASLQFAELFGFIICKYACLFFPNAAFIRYCATKVMNLQPCLPAREPLDERYPSGT